MKTKMKVPLALIIAVLPQLAPAQNNGVGGGNLCREEIEQHRAQIEGWIKRDEARDLDFTKALEIGWTYDDPAPAKSYKRAMLEVLKPGKVIVNCYDDLEALNRIAAAYGQTVGRPSIGGGCINYEDEKGFSHIDCYSKTERNYRLIHHEYASIAGVEKRLGTESSDFSISDQVSDFQYTKTVTLLGPRRSPMINVGDKEFHKIIEERYAQAGPLTKEESEGTHAGRCFEDDSSVHGVLFLVRSFPAMAGPLFGGEKGIWKSAYIEPYKAPYEDIERVDTASYTKVEDFWKSDQGKSAEANLIEIDGTIQSRLDVESRYSTHISHMVYETRKGNDGILYGRASRIKEDGEKKVYTYCYFFKKLFQEKKLK